MTKAELSSTLAIAAILVWVRVVTGQAMFDILMAHLPDLF